MLYKPRSNYEYARLGSERYTPRRKEASRWAEERKKLSIYSGRLPDRRIRVLHLYPIFPSGDYHGDVLRCTLHEVSLDDAPVYQALSYVWGEPSVQSEILCNGISCLVTTNLKAALIAHRHSMLTRILWVDALCINQEDILERNSQVRMMKEIYAGAVLVLIWLGEPDGVDTKAAKDAVLAITQAVEPHIEEEGTAWLGDVGTIKVEADELPPHRIVALQALFHLPWFTRVWCVQEAACAQSRMLRWGRTEIEWRDLWLNAEWIAGQKSLYGAEAPYRLGLIDINFVLLMCYARIDCTGLLELLHSYHIFSATDPRDKVYALVGLAASTEGQYTVEVDYGKRWQLLYVQVASMLIGSRYDLYVLSDVQHSEGYDGISDCPSLVPDWSQVSRTGGRIWAEGDGYLLYRACGAFNLEKIAISSSESLWLAGNVFDSLEFTTDTVGSEMIGWRITGSELTPFSQLLDMWLIAQPSSEASDGLVALADMLARGLDEQNYVAMSDLDESGRAQIQLAFNSFVAKLCECARDGAQSSGWQELCAMEHFSRYLMAAYTACHLRRFFRTTRGHYGMGPACMRPGDIVVVLHGGLVPYMLRPRGEAYLFLGDCFVHDIMDGQVFDVYKDVCEERMFELL